MKFKIIPNKQTPKIADYKDIDSLLREDRKLLEKFISFSMRQKNCVGLASNQVSVDGNRIMQPFFTIKDKNGWSIIIHPKIIGRYGRSFDEIESCLTWRGKKIKAKRYKRINVAYFNLRGEEKLETISGFQAQIWQHECNHLLGIEEKFE